MILVQRCSTPLVFRIRAIDRAPAALVDVVNAREIAELMLIVAPATARRLGVIFADQIPSQGLTSIRVSAPAANNRLVNGTLVSGYRCALVSTPPVAPDNGRSLPLKPSSVCELRDVAAQETWKWMAWGVHSLQV